MTNTSVVISIALPHAQSPVGRGLSAACGARVGLGVGFGASVGSGSGVGFGEALTKACVCSGIGVGAGLEAALTGACVGTRVCEGLGSGVALNSTKASHERLSALTCIPYLRPACLALVQLKNLSPFLGLKLWQLPHILLLIAIAFYEGYSTDFRDCLVGLVLYSLSIVAMRLEAEIQPSGLARWDYSLPIAPWYLP